MKKAIISSVIILLITGCVSTKQSHIYSDLNVKTVSNLDADIEVDLSKKLTGTSHSQYLFGFFQLSGDSEFADGYGGMGSVGATKSAAAFKAIKQSDADVLVSPQYVVEVNDQLIIKDIVVTVTGYGGKFVSIKND